MRDETPIAYVVVHGFRTYIGGPIHGIVLGGAFGRPQEDVLVECDHSHNGVAEALRCSESLVWDIELPRPTLVNFADREPVTLATPAPKEADR